MSTNSRFNLNDVIAIPTTNGLRPALIVEVDDGAVNYSFIDSEGNLQGGGRFRGEYEMKEVRKIDFATVRTVVDLPRDWKNLAFLYEYEKKRCDAKRKEDLGESDPETHPSYGSITVTRAQGGRGALFGSPFRHQHYISMTIGRASRQRSLGQDWHHGGVRGELIEVSMSESQWARMISSLGLGGGTPCTIDRIGTAQMEPCPDQLEVERFHEDTRKASVAAVKFLQEAERALNNLVKEKAPSKASREEIAALVTKARQKMEDAAPFVVSQLDERMEAIVKEGKTEIEAFANATIVESGLLQLAKTLGKEPPTLTGGEKTVKTPLLGRRSTAGTPPPSDPDEIDIERIG